MVISDEQKLRRVYNQGYAAFHDGRKEEDNPHYHSTDGSLSEWNRGFHDAEDEDKEYKQQNDGE